MIKKVVKILKSKQSCKEISRWDLYYILSVSWFWQKKNTRTKHQCKKGYL